MVYSESRGSRPILSIFIGLLLCAILGGIFYVYSRLHAVPPFIDPWNAASYASLYPTTCTIAEGDFTDQLRGTEYVADGNFRADYTTNGDSGSAQYHLLVLKDKSYALWSNPPDAPIVVIAPTSSEGTICAPWWFSDDSIFQVPPGVNAQVGNS